MKREILIRGADPRDIAVMEDGRLCEYLPAGEAGGNTGTVCVGKIVRVLKGMDAAFVEIGEERNAYLPLREKHLPEDAAPLREGGRVLVQVVREAHGEKGAFLTRDISLGGQYLILMPRSASVGVSDKLNGAQAARLRKLGTELSGGSCGLVMRTACAQAEETEIRAELETLRETWERIRNAAPTAHVPSELWRQTDPLTALLDDYLPRGVDCVISDDPAVERCCAGRCPFRLVQTDPLQTAGVPAKLREGLQRRVWLKSGGNLIIDECEALTVIDVNTAKFTGKRPLEHNLTHVNLEACAEIARQIRLRALGGIIIMDMMDMDARENRDAVIQTLRQAFEADRSKTVIHGFTSLGLIEMTRRRTRRPLRESLQARREEETGHGAKSVCP